MAILTMALGAVAAVTVAWFLAEWILRKTDDDFK